jgi:hypothetical protein
MDIDDHARAESFLMMLGDGVGVRPVTGHVERCDASPDATSACPAASAGSPPALTDRAQSSALPRARRGTSYAAENGGDAKTSPRFIRSMMTNSSGSR